MRAPSILAALALSASAHGAVLTAVELPQPAGPRHFLMAAPEHPAAGKRPLVLLFHGHMGSAAQVIGPKNLSAM